MQAEIAAQQEVDATHEQGAAHLDKSVRTHGLASSPKPHMLCSPHMFVSLAGSQTLYFLQHMSHVTQSMDETATARLLSRLDTVKYPAVRVVGQAYTCGTTHMVMTRPHRGVVFAYAGHRVVSQGSCQQRRHVFRRVGRVGCLRGGRPGCGWRCVAIDWPVGRPPAPLRRRRPPSWVLLRHGAACTDAATHLAVRVAPRARNCAVLCAAGVAVVVVVVCVVCVVCVCVCVCVCVSWPG